MGRPSVARGHGLLQAAGLPYWERAHCLVDALEEGRTDDVARVLAEVGPGQLAEVDLVACARLRGDSETVEMARRVARG